MTSNVWKYLCESVRCRERVRGRERLGSVSTMVERETERERQGQQRKGGATEEVRERETTNIRAPVSDSPLSPSSASQTPVTCHPPHQRPSPFPPPLPVLPYAIATIQSYYSLQYRTPIDSTPFDGGTYTRPRSTRSRRPVSLWPWQEQLGS